MSAKHDFLVVQDGPKMIYLEQLLSHFCQNLTPKSLILSAYHRFLWIDKKLLKNYFFVTHFGIFRGQFVRKKISFLTFVSYFFKY